MNQSSLLEQLGQVSVSEAEGGVKGYPSSRVLVGLMAGHQRVGPLLDSSPQELTQRMAMFSHCGVVASKSS